MKEGGGYVFTIKKNQWPSYVLYKYLRCVDFILEFSFSPAIYRCDGDTKVTEALDYLI